MSRRLLMSLLALLAATTFTFAADDGPPSSSKSAGKKARKKADRSKQAAPATPASPMTSTGSAAEVTAPVFALKGARILTAAGPIYDPGVLVVSDGKILDVGPVGKTTVPTHAQIIDVAGKVIIPGLVDTHSHLGVYSRPAVEANSDGNEMTGPVQGIVRALDAVNPYDPGIRMANAGGVTAANIMPGSGNVIGGQTIYVKLRGYTPEQMWIESPDVLGGLKMANGENPKRAYGGKAKAPGTRMKVAALQMTSGPDVAANLAQAAALLEEAARRGAQLAALPENFSFMGLKDADKRAVAEPDGRGPVQDFLAASARRLKLWIVGGTTPLKGGADGRVAAASLVYDADGARVARYDKIHLFDVDLPGRAESYRESADIAPGARRVLVPTPAGLLGLSICYDMRFPELYRQLSAAGLLVTAGSSSDDPERVARIWVHHAAAA